MVDLFQKKIFLNNCKKLRINFQDFQDYDLQFFKENGIQLDHLEIKNSSQISDRGLMQIPRTRLNRHKTFGIALFLKYFQFWAAAIDRFGIFGHFFPQRIGRHGHTRDDPLKNLDFKVQ